jgi:hypothetical protein
MQFRVDQRFAASADDVLAMYCDTEFYATLEGLPRIGRPEVLSAVGPSDEGGKADRFRLRLRYAFIGDLPRAALAVIEPKKLTWVEDTDFDLISRKATSNLLPDNYADRLTASAKSTIDDAGDGHSSRRVDGDLHIRMPFVGGQVEKAIVSGLREHLVAEEVVAARWLQDHR